MSGNKKPNNDGKVRYGYSCDDYRKNKDSGCRPNYIPHETLANLVKSHLAELEQDLESLTLKNLYQRRTKTRKRWAELRAAIDKILYDALPELYHYEQDGLCRVFSVPRQDDEDELVRIPGCSGSIVQELLDQVEYVRDQGCKAKMGELRARHTKLYDAFVDATPGIRK